jgi:hypothetical protein
MSGAGVRPPEDAVTTLSHAGRSAGNRLTYENSRENHLLGEETVIWTVGSVEQRYTRKPIKRFMIKQKIMIR